MDINKSKYNFEDFVQVIEILRSPKGCPWDKEQTHESLKSNLIEESYEFLSEIDKNNVAGMKEELGDVLLQVVMHAQIAKDNKTFDINDVIDGITKKMIFRHPHVFNREKAADVQEAYDIFKQQKEKEKHFTKQVDVLKSIPDSFPALIKTEKIINKLYKMYPEFAKDNENQVLEEIKKEVSKINENPTEAQIGKILLDLVTLCKKTDIDAEIALSKYTQNIINKFEIIEDEFIKNNEDILKLEMEKLKNIIEK